MIEYTDYLLVSICFQGSSLGQFFQQYLKPIKLNDVKVDWKSMNLSYLMEVSISIKTNLMSQQVIN